MFKALQVVPLHVQGGEGLPRGTHGPPVALRKLLNLFGLQLPRHFCGDSVRREVRVPIVGQTLGQALEARVRETGGPGLERQKAPVITAVHGPPPPALPDAQAGQEGRTMEGSRMPGLHTDGGCHWRHGDCNPM